MKKLSIIFLICSGIVSAIRADGPPVEYLYCHGLGESGLNLNYVSKQEEDYYIDIEASPEVFKTVLALSNNLTNEEKRIRDEEMTRNSWPNYGIMGMPKYTFSFPFGKKILDKTQSKSKRMRTNRVANKVGFKDKMSWAQDIEIDSIKQAMGQISGDIICFGRCVGASSLITYAGNCDTNRDHAGIKKIRALVLEAPFDTYENVLKQKFGVFNALGMGKMSSYLMYPNYSPTGIKPLHCASGIPHTIPVILIHSKNDSKYPVSCSRELYIELKKAGHPSVHLFELDSADHNNAMWSADNVSYQNVVHAFYKQYDLPHNAERAQAGQNLFAQTQPTIAQVRNRR